MSVCAEMPKYKSHKTVWALRIAFVTRIEGGDGYITPADEGYGSVPVTAAYLDKHNPQPGGYYVVYADGYKSWSPAEAFESGYTRI